MSQPADGLLGALYRHRRLLSGVAIVWFTVVTAGGIFLSQLGARRGLHVFGPKAWVAGGPNVVRVALRDLQFNLFEPLSSVTVRVVGSSGETVEEFVLTETVGPFVQGVVVPPRAGPWTLELAGVAEVGEISAQLTVEASEIATLAFPPPPKPSTPLKPDRGPVAIDIRPTDHVVAGGVPSRLSVRAMLADGSPASVAVALEVKEGKSAVPLPSQVVTDHNGLAHFSVQPMHPTFWFEASTSDSHATRRLRPTPAQFSLQLSAPLAQPEQVLDYRLFALHRAGPVFVDTWVGDRWLGTQGGELSEGQAAGKVTLPRPATDPALVWVQAYRTAYLPGTARGGRYVLVSRQAAEDAGRWLRDQLVATGDPDAAHLKRLTRLGDPDVVRYLLGRLPRPDMDPPLVADSSVTVRHQTQALKERWQRRFVIALVASACVLFLGLAWLMRQNNKQVRQGWAEFAEDEDGAEGTRAHLRRDFGYIFLVLALFIFGMIQMLLTIRW